jgi:hypothetical protein
VHLTLPLIPSPAVDMRLAGTVKNKKGAKIESINESRDNNLAMTLSNAHTKGIIR